MSWSLCLRVLSLSLSLSRRVEQQMCLSKLLREQRDRRDDTQESNIIATSRKVRLHMLVSLCLQVLSLGVFVRCAMHSVCDPRVIQIGKGQPKLLQDRATCFNHGVLWISLMALLVSLRWYLSQGPDPHPQGPHKLDARWGSERRCAVHRGVLHIFCGALVLMCCALGVTTGEATPYICACRNLRGEETPIVAMCLFT